MTVADSIAACFLPSSFPAARNFAWSNWYEGVDFRSDFLAFSVGPQRNRKDAVDRATRDILDRRRIRPERRLGESTTALVGIVNGTGV